MIVRPVFMMAWGGIVRVMMMVVVFVELVDQPEMVQVRVRGGREPQGHQQERHDAPNGTHSGSL